MFEVSVARGLFSDYDTFKKALSQFHDAGVYRYTAYGPTNLKEIEDLMPAKSSLVRGFATLGAVLGLIIFWLVCVLTSLIYSLIVGGKPPISNVPFVIPAYEGTILIGSIFAFIAGLFFAALGPHKPPPDYDKRFSENRYGVDVYCKPSDKEYVVDMLMNLGAEEVSERR